MADTPSKPPHDAAEIHEALADPQFRTELAESLLEALQARRPPSAWQRLQPWIAGAASASVTMLAFFLPSLQEQWDRWRARDVVERYVQVGRSFMEQSRYGLAEQAFARAFELSENQRLDVEVLRLQARVEQVNVDPEWGRANPKALRESDFLYLIELQRGHARARAASLSSYAVFLAGEHRYEEAERAVRQSLAVDSSSSVTWIHLGNVLADRERPGEAEQAYRRAVALDPEESAAHLDLGLLLGERGRADSALVHLERAARLDPGDRDALSALADQLRAMGRKTEADSLERRLARMPRRSPEPVGTFSKPGDEDSP